MTKKKVEYFKVLGYELKTKNGFQWKPGQWNEEPNAVKTDEACGIGLHVFVGKPNWNFTHYIPDHTYRVLDVEGKCGADKEKARFKRVKLARLPMTLEEILGTDRSGLKGAFLASADLSRAELYRADLSGATLYTADLISANLHSANLRGAVLVGSRLFRANLAAADLHEARLDSSDLTLANLQNANLSGADLYGANLEEADLTGANFTGALNCKHNKWLSGKQKKQAKS